MAEYIERESLIAEIQKNINTYWNEESGGYYLAEDALNYSVKTAPTADVVPKSEVERLQAEVDQLHALLECGVFANSVEDWQKFLNEKRAEVAREIFAEIEKIRAKEIHKCEILRVQENEASERKYWEGGEHSLRQLSYWIAELKKKYME